MAEAWRVYAAGQERRWFRANSSGGGAVAAATKAPTSPGNALPGRSELAVWPLGGGTARAVIL